MAASIESVKAAAARAATDPALWPETLWQLGQLVGSDMTVVDHLDKQSGRVEIGFNDRPDLVAATREAYEQHYYALNPRWQLAQWLPMDSISHDDLIGDDKALGAFEYYVDFLGPSGLKYFIASPLVDDAGQTAVLTMQRNAERGRATAEDLANFAAVLPDLRNAMAIHARLRRHAAFEAALALMGDPLAVIHGDGRLVFANPAMAGLLECGSIVRLWGGAIEGATPPLQRAFRALLREAGTSNGLARELAWRPEGPVVMRMAPLDPEAGRPIGGAARCYCLLIDDPSRPHWPQIEEAMALFGLTRREAEVGTHLAAGLGADEIARRLRVSRNTVRTHIAMLREKLGLHSALAVAAAMRRAVSPFG